MDQRWLEEAGWCKSAVNTGALFLRPNTYPLYLTPHEGRWEPTFEPSRHNYITFADCKTRGDVRRLLTALGIIKS